MHERIINSDSPRKYQNVNKDTFTNWGYYFYAGNPGDGDDVYILEVDSLVWTNMDSYVNIAEFIECTFNAVGLPSGTTANIHGYAIYDVQNTVAGMPFVTDFQIEAKYFPALAMHVVIIGFVDGNMYSGVLPLTPEDGESYDINMSSTTAADLDVLLNSL